MKIKRLVSEDVRVVRDELRLGWKRTRPGGDSRAQTKKSCIHLSTSSFSLCRTLNKIEIRPIYSAYTQSAVIVTLTVFCSMAGGLLKCYKGNIYVYFNLHITKISYINLYMGLNPHVKQSSAVTFIIITPYICVTKSKSGWCQTEN